MALSNAERQCRYRQARLEVDGPEEERLDITINIDARYALQRIAAHNQTTQKATLEQILTEAQEALHKTLDWQAQSDYWKLK